jgi:hypothetical protein
MEPNYLRQNTCSNNNYNRCTTSYSSATQESINDPVKAIAKEELKYRRGEHEYQ